MTQLVLGVDVGTFETKACLVDDRGALVATAVRGHGISTPEPSHVEHDADAIWWSDVTAVVRELLAHPGVLASQIAAICCSGIGPCVLPLRAGRPLRPAILYGIDTRASQQISELNRRLGVEAIRERAGSELSSQSAGPKIAWIRDEEPEVFGRADMFATTQTYIVGRLTDEWVIDHGTAAYFHPLYDLPNRCWDEAGCYGVVETLRLPRLAWAGEVAGRVTKVAAIETGLEVGTPVLVGSADAPAEALSAGVRESGDTMLMYGSSHFVIQLRSNLVHAPGLYAAPYLFPDLSLLAGGTSTAGTISRWFWSLTERGAGPDFGRLVAEAAASPPGARGALALPYFSGERAPVNDPDLTGVIAGLTLGHGREDIYRSLLEGIGFGVANVFDSFSSYGEPVREVTAVGGGTRHDVWTQIISDVCDVRQFVHTGPGASFGDAILAALAAGMLSSRDAISTWIPTPVEILPDPERVDFYRALRPVWRDFDEANRVISHRLRSMHQPQQREQL